MREMHTRIMCRCITWNVVISQLSLLEARVTHVRVKNEPSTPPKASLVHAKIYFLVYLWQGIANGLNVKCSKLYEDEKIIHNEFTHNEIPA